MKTPADTADASAAFTGEGMQFLPDDPKYRMTGELPADTEDDSAASTENEEQREGDEHEQHEADNQDGSATSTSEIAAASEAAEAQRKTGKTAGRSDTRWQKLSRDNRDLREQLARAEGREEGRNSGTQGRETAQGSQPAAVGKAEAEPQIGDIDPRTNQPKYTTLADYLKAVRDWDRKESRKEWEQMSTKTQRERQQADNEQIVERTVNQRAAAARKTFADYDDVMDGALEIKNEYGQDAFFYVKGSPIDGFFLDSDRGHEVMYAIGKDFDTHGHIFARDAKGNYLLHPVRQLRELSKIENSLPAKNKTGAPGSSSAKTVTQAPKPPHQVSGNGSVTKDATEKAVEEGDFESYSAAENAKALARRRASKPPARATAVR